MFFVCDASDFFFFFFLLQLILSLLGHEKPHHMVVCVRALHAHAESPATYVTLLTGHGVHLSRGCHGVVMGTVDLPGHH